MTREDRLKRLARNIEALAEDDQREEERAREIGRLRRQAAADLHAVCARFLASVNRLLPRTALELGPPEYRPEAFRDTGVNLFQLNIHGRLIQITFSATEKLVSTEHFKTPYILEGEIRAFNQEMLDRIAIEEQRLFFCLEKGRNGWVLEERRGNRPGPFDEDVLLDLMERLV